MGDSTAEGPSEAREFWDERFQGDVEERSERTFRNVEHAAYGFWNTVGDVEGLSVLDIGCGLGQVAVLLAKRGAEVLATDLSAGAVEKTTQNAQKHGVSQRVTVRKIDALELGDLGESFDLVVGRFVLHHIEPFGEFVDVLDRLIKPGGRAVFLENNSRNRILMLARNHASGRFGVPKHGDEDEHPLEPREVALLAGRFAEVRQEYPRFIFLGKLNTYVFRHRPIFRPLMDMNLWLDRIAHKYLPFLRKYSYEQIVEIRKDGGTQSVTAVSTASPSQDRIKGDQSPSPVVRSSRRSDRPAPDVPPGH